jgi:predicted HNH restriction endonuclease
MGDHYSEQEIWVIESEYEEGSHYKVIAQMLRRSPEGIRKKIRRLGIKGFLPYCKECGVDLGRTPGDIRVYCKECLKIHHRRAALNWYYATGREKKGGKRKSKSLKDE